MSTDFQRLLLKRISEEHEKRAETLCGSSLLANGDVGVVGLRYAQAVGYLEGLNATVRMCEEVIDQINAG